MDDVVIGVILAVAGTVIVFAYLAYRFFRIIGSEDNPD